MMDKSELLKLLPTEKVNICGRDYEDGYNQALEDVKQALMRNDITPSKRGDDGTQIQ
jgi:hypothetical protein